MTAGEIVLGKVTAVRQFDETSFQVRSVMLRAPGPCLTRVLASFPMWFIDLFPSVHWQLESPAKAFLLRADGRAELTCWLQVLEGHVKAVQVGPVVHSSNRKR
jgi:hypothetical protein